MQEKAEKEKKSPDIPQEKIAGVILTDGPSWKEMQSSWQPADSLIRVPVPQVTDTASQEKLWD